MKKLKKLAFLFLNISYLKALLFGCAAGIEHILFLKNFRSQDLKTIIDIGANKGQFSLIAKNFFPNANIFAFEPLTRPYEKFIKIFNKIENVKIYKYAIGTFDDEVMMNISKREDSSSILEIGPLQKKIFQGTDKVNEEKIYVSPIDKMLEINKIHNPSLLKIDVQGYELEVLKGCKNILDKIDHIYCECSFIELYKNQAIYSQVCEWLYDYNFSVESIYNPSYDDKGQMVQADIYFKKNKKSSIII